MTYCSGDGLAECPECSCDFSNDCSTCMGEGFIPCIGCEACAAVEEEPALPEEPGR